jgi:hypothetical protein
LKHNLVERKEKIAELNGLTNLLKVLPPLELRSVQMNQKTFKYDYLLKCFFVLLAVIVVSVNSFAQQETGQISGTVIDQNSAAVANATVTVKSIDTGRTVTVQSSDDGTFNVTNLQPGIYEVTTSAQGFQSRSDRVQVTVGAKLALNPQLGVTGTSASVEVVAGGLAEINTSDQQLSSVVTGKQITEIPTLTRNPYDLVALSGNVSDVDPSGRGAGVAINGQRSASTSILLDGAENVATFTATVGQQIPLDAVGEFRVITSNFSAEYGRASGGIVNAVTKSGTNNFNGAVYAFNRNSKFASNSFDNNARGIERPNFNRNQFGYAVGGPVWRDKLFFFNSTEWIRVRSTDSVTAFVPSQALLNASNVNTRNYFQLFGTIAPGVQTVPLAANEIITDPRVAGGTAPLFNKVRFVVPADAGGGFPQNTYQTVTRIDGNLTDKTQITGRYAVENNKPFAGNYDVSPYAGFTVGTTNFNHNFMINGTHVFASNFTSQSKYAYNRLAEKNTIGADPNTPTLSGNFGIAGLPVYFPGFLSLFPGIGLPTSGAQQLHQFNQDFTWNRGDHNFRFGGQFIFIRDRKNFPAYQNASQVLGFNRTTVINNLLNGTLQDFSGAINPQGQFPGGTVRLPLSPPNFTRINRYKEYAVYINDQWRIIPRVTLNLGLRYEFYGPQRHVDPSEESNFFLGSGSNIFERIRNGSVKLTSETGALWGNDNNNFAPRIGIAWDVFGDGKTSVRGGYGIAYERNFGNVTFNVIQNPPNYGVLSFTPADVGGTLPIFTNSAGPLSGSSGTRILGRVSLRAVDPDIVNAYAHFWSAAGEHRLSRDTVVSVAYSGSAGRDLYSIANINRPNSGTFYLNSTATCGALGASARLNPCYSNINFRSNGGRSNYHGVTASLDSNNLFGVGLTITNRYTYSVAKDNLSSTFSDGNNGNFVLGFLDPFNPDLDYGYADYDVRHRFVSGFVWDIGAGRNYNNPITRNVLGGWQLTGNFNIRSGAPFTVYDSTNCLLVCTRLVPTAAISSFSGSGDRRSVGTNEFLYIDLSNQTPGVYADRFGTQEFGPYPSNMTRRNAFRGPGFWNLDLGAYKTFRFTEKYRLQLRAEAFNVLNRANYFLNGSTIDIASSETVNVSKAGRRNMQFAAKFLF